MGDRARRLALLYELPLKFATATRLEALLQNIVEKLLDIIPGAVRRFPPGLKVPHMGWNQVEHRGDLALFDGIPSGADFYFVHSYYPTTADASLQVATCTYGVAFPAAVGRGALFATQFHPEKSQRWGLRLLENFAAFVRDGRA